MEALIKLQGSEYIIRLISQELKSRRFFNAFQELGLNDARFQPHLDALILEALNLNAESDEAFEAYSALMDKHAHRIDTTKESVRKEAQTVYEKLIEKTGPTQR